MQAHILCCKNQGVSVLIRPPSYGDNLNEYLYPVFEICFVIFAQNVNYEY